MTLEDGGEVEADEVLFATGREPLTDDIGLDTVGLVPGSWLEVDDTCLVQPVDPAPGAPTRSPPTTARCRRCSSAIPRSAPSASPPTGPNAPGTASASSTSTSAVAVPGAGLYADGYTGRARMVVDEDHDYLLGVTFVGPGVEELIHSATIAVAGQVPISDSGTPSPASPPSAKSGSASSMPTGPEPDPHRSSVPHHRPMFIPNGPWRPPSTVMQARVRCGCAHGLAALRM